MPDIVDLPGNLRISDRSDPMLIANTRSGGLSINGIEQIISPLSQRWVWQCTIPVMRKDQARSLRVVLAQLQGRFNYLRTRICDQYRVSRQEMGAVPTILVPHSDGAPFSDGTGYDLAGGTSHPGASYSAGVSVIAFEPTLIPLRSGTFFSINSWLYVITNIDDGGLVHIAPPLRESVTSDDEINFDAECLWSLTADTVGQLNLQIGRFGYVTFDLVEPVGRT